MASEENTDNMESDSKFEVAPVYRQALVVSGVVLYMTGSGANLAFPGALLAQLRAKDSPIRLELHHESWIASLLGLALMAGISVAPFALQSFGRKTTNWLGSLPNLAGWILMVAAQNPEQLLGSRVLQGFGMGLQAASAPVSIAEYSSPANRGAFLATIAFSIATGMLVAHGFGTILPWRLGALCCGSVYILSFIIVILSPETPSWLASKGRIERCKKSFRWLRGVSVDSEKELEKIITSQMKEINLVNSNAKVTKFRYFMNIVKKPEFYKPTIIMFFMFTLFQISGITVIPSYSVLIMDEVTNQTLEPYSATLVLDLIRFLSACLACFVINRYPRRFVLMLGCSISIVSLVAISGVMFLRDFGYIREKNHWLPVIPLAFYIFGVTIGILPIPWAIAGEIFPLAYRSIGSGISGLVLSGMLFAVVKTAPFLFKAIGVNGTFLVYALGIAICAVFLHFLLPETRGKTLYEIECHFKGIKDDVRIDGQENDTMVETTLLNVEKYTIENTTEDNPIVVINSE